MIELVDRNNNKTEIVYGKSPAGTLEQAKDACCNINWVRNDINEIKSHFIKLGFHLEEISRCEIYKVFGFDDFYEFCEANFHLSRSTVSRHVALFLRFSSRNGKHSETPTMFIDERWKDYNYSQLCEMLPLSDRKLEGVNPKMTVKEIREYKAGLKNKACATSHKTKRCDFNPYYECDIKRVMKKYFKEKGNIVGCVGCCSICLEKERCQYACEYETALKRLNFLESKAQREPGMTVCDVAQTESLPDPETCEDDEDSEDDITFYFLASEVDAVMENLHHLKLFLDDKSYDMALVSLDTLCVRLKRLFGV